MIKTYIRTPKDKAIHTIDKPISGSWISVTRPTHEDLVTVTKVLDLDIDTLQDALDPYEAPRIAMDESDVYVFTRYCHPENKLASTEPLLILITETEIVTVSPYAVDFLNKLSTTLRTNTHDRVKLLLEILEQSHETYRSYLDQIIKLTFKIRTQLSTSTFTNKDFLKMIDIEEDLNEMLTSLQPNGILLETLHAEKIFKLSPDEKEMLEDLRLESSELIEITKARLRTVENIREVYNTISNASLNETFKKLTSIAIFLSIPTIVGGLYGMNIQLPLATEKYAFFEIVGIVAILVSTAVIIFKRKKWL
jgi:magnesium transporter